MTRLQVALALCLLALVLSAATFAAELAPGDVMLKTEIENYGVRQGVTPVIYDGVTAMAFRPDAVATGGVKLAPGDYTLLVRCYAPAGDQDGFYVEIDGQRTRRTAPIGSWGTLAYPFTVEREHAVAITIIGQEDGMSVDAIAVVRGTHKDNDPKLEDVPGEMAAGMQVSLDDLPRLMLPCELAEVPQGPLTRDEHTVYLQDFDNECLGATGENHPVEGRWGMGLYLGFPDGRFDIDARSLELREQGTIEWWVRPRPAQELWWDQGWHYFLHCHAQDEDGLQLDLSRHPVTELRLVASSSEGPYYTQNAPGTREGVQMSTSSLDGNEWHHLLVSWDLSGAREHIWLLVDGVGRHLFFEKTHTATGFSRIELCNTPAEWDVPLLPMDGAIDDVRIQNVSVAGRLAK